MPTRNVLKRLEALEEAKVPASEAVKIIRLVSPHDRSESFGTAIDMLGHRLFFPGDPSESEDVLAAMYWLAYPEGKQVILAAEANQANAGALVIPPCPASTDVLEHAQQQMARLSPQ